MKTHFLLFAFAMFAFASCTKTETPKPVVSNPEPVFDSTSIYSYSFTSIEGEQVKLSDFKGKKLLIVNTASFCGYTPQYEGLEKLYEQYKDKLVIIGFPSDDFEQEFDNDEEIKDFCEARNISFPLSESINVTSSHMHPVYKWLTTKRLNNKLDSEVLWNFQKYLVDENGVLLEMYRSHIEPNSPSITNYLK